MSELIKELEEMQKGFIQMARDNTGSEPNAICVRAFHISETCRKAVEELKRNIPQKMQHDPVEVELEGGGHTWWYVCGECHGAIDDSDRYCKHCGRPLKNQVIRDIEKKRKLEEEWVESEFGIYREN